MTTKTTPKLTDIPMGPAWIVPYLPASLADAVKAIHGHKLAMAEGETERLADATWPCEFARNGHRLAAAAAREHLSFADTPFAELPRSEKWTRADDTRTWFFMIRDAWRVSGWGGLSKVPMLIPEEILAGVEEDFRPIHEAYLEDKKTSKLVAKPRETVAHHHVSRMDVPRGLLEAQRQLAALEA